MSPLILSYYVYLSLHLDKNPSETTRPAMNRHNVKISTTIVILSPVGGTSDVLLFWAYVVLSEVISVSSSVVISELSSITENSVYAEPSTHSISTVCVPTDNVSR